MNTAVLIIIVVGALAALYYFLWRGTRRSASDPSHGFVRGVKAVTPLGVTVYRRKEPITGNMLAAIDDAFTRGFAVARFNGFQNPNIYVPRHYIIELEEPNPKCGGTGFSIGYSGFPGDPYDNSEFDKDPAKGSVEMCVAERVLGATSYLGEIIDTSTKWDANGPIVTGKDYQQAVIRVVANPNMIAEATYNGLEHVFEAAEKRMADFWAHLDHTGGKGHPYLAQP